MSTKTEGIESTEGVTESRTSNQEVECYFSISESEYWDLVVAQAVASRKIEGIEWMLIRTVLGCELRPRGRTSAKMNFEVSLPFEEAIRIFMKTENIVILKALLILSV